MFQSFVQNLSSIWDEENFILKYFVPSICPVFCAGTTNPGQRLIDYNLKNVLPPFRIRSKQNLKDLNSYWAKNKIPGASYRIFFTLFFLVDSGINFPYLHWWGEGGSKFPSPLPRRSIESLFTLLQYTFVIRHYDLPSSRIIYSDAWSNLIFTFIWVR